MKIPKLTHIKIKGIWYWKCPVCGRLLAPHDQPWQNLPSKGSASRHLGTHNKKFVKHGRNVMDIIRRKVAK